MQPNIERRRFQKMRKTFRYLGIVFSTFLSEASIELVRKEFAAGLVSRVVLLVFSSVAAGFDSSWPLTCPLLTWLAKSLSSSWLSNISVSSESVKTSVPSPSKMMRPLWFPVEGLFFWSISTSYPLSLSSKLWWMPGPRNSAILIISATLKG